MVKQKYGESVSDYIRRFRDVKNRCFSLTIAEKDLADLAFSGLFAHLKEKLDGQEFLGINQVLQKALIQENYAKEVKQYSRFKDGKNRDKEKHTVNTVDCSDEDLASDEDTDICVAGWVHTSKTKPFVCTALKPAPTKRGEMKYTFDVSKCDKIFDTLLQGKQIRLTEGHVIPSAEELGRKAYCKWHHSFSHATNDCNVFRRQIQSAINDGRLTIKDGGKMKLDSDPFPVNVIVFANKKMLIRSHQTESAEGKNVVVHDSVPPRMIKPKNPEVGVWKVNKGKKPVLKPRPRPTFKQLLEKYTSQKNTNAFSQFGGAKRPRSPPGHSYGDQGYWHGESYVQQPYFAMGPMHWGYPPPVYPQFPSWGCDPWAPYPAVPVTHFQQGWNAPVAIGGEHLYNQRGREARASDAIVINGGDNNLSKRKRLTVPARSNSLKNNMASNSIKSGSQRMWVPIRPRDDAGASVAHEGGEVGPSSVVVSRAVATLDESRAAGPLKIGDVVIEKPELAVAAIEELKTRGVGSSS